jgi:hypothetical protein
MAARTIKRTASKVGVKTGKKKTLFDPDPKIAGAYLVPLDKAFDVVGIKVSPRVLPNTVVRVRKDGIGDDTGIGLVTTLPDGTRVAWDVCGRCTQHIVNCVCKDGIYHTASIAWCVSRTEEWMGGAEHVPGRYFEPTVYARRIDTPQTVPFRPSRPVKPSVDPEAVFDAPVGRKGSSARQKAVQDVDTSDVDNLDLAVLAREAISASESYSDIFDSIVNAEPKKRRITRGKKSS